MLRWTLLLLAMTLTGAVVLGQSTEKPKLIADPEAFPTLVNPQCSHCTDEAQRRADLKPDDRVLCWIRGYSNGGAIPLRFFLNKYPVISDTYGVFVYDAAAGYTRGFAPSLDFKFHGWRNGIMVMKRKDGTLYSCLSGRALDGPDKGTRLRPVATLASDWGRWLKLYPNAVAYKMFDKYQPTALSPRFEQGAAKSLGPIDKRLLPEQPVLGVFSGGEARAYPLELVAKKGLIEDQLGAGRCVVLWFEPTRTAVAYEPLATPPEKVKAAPRLVNLERSGKNPAAPFADRETGSQWDIAGRAIAGPLRGWTLNWLDSVEVKWYAWAAEHPETTIYRK
jgi:hypothetical protein